MPRLTPLFLIAAMPLSACAPAADPPPAEAAAGATLPSPVSPTGSISGAIVDGNRPPPAMRICAHPVAGGTPTCMDSPSGAATYRLDVAAGRYLLMGWVQGGEVALIAHTARIRCIRAPCPPDELIEVDVASGEHTTGIDLASAYTDIPAGWPARP